MEKLEKALAELTENAPNIEVLDNEDMSAHCSFKVGGPVRACIMPKNVFELAKAAHFLHENDVAPLVLGNCTNVLIPDEGLDICVLSTQKLTKLRLGETPDTIYAEAGVSLSRLAQFAQQNGLSGLEFASGIPGTVGGGIIMNAGAYGGEMKDVVESVIIYYLPEQTMLEVFRDNCGFDYRSSEFQKISCAVMSAVFKLTPDDPEAIAERMRSINEKRREKQPLDLPSCGSAFKRPKDGYAAELIDRCGLKGYTVGGAQVSEKHAGFVVNIGGAKYDDVVELMDHVRREVYAKTGATLEPEIKIYPKGLQLIDDWRVRRMQVMQSMEESVKQKMKEQEQQGG